MKDKIDKWLCFLILKLGYRDETYLGVNCHGHHVFYVDKVFLGFRKETNETKKYHDTIDFHLEGRFFRKGYREVDA